jgi:hypothetical protein
VAKFGEISDLDKYSPLPPDPYGPDGRPVDGLVNLETDPVTGRTLPPRPQGELEPGRKPSLIERLLGPQMQMAQTGFYSLENDYTGISGTIVRKGAHIAVADSLAKIQFVAGTSGGMQNRVAYIQYWSKSSVEQKTTAPIPVTQTSTQSSVQDKVAQALTELQFRTLANLPVDLSAVGGARSADLPETFKVNPAPLPFQTPATLPSITPSNLGVTYNANPGTPSQTPQANQAVWQFLFNPEELQLESGPDYNRAETWGVSDPENSGQPLSWRSNKNRKLTFGKVLLTGYVLGRRVDSLEKGLQQLFMARSGPGMDGPPVLEFVWGVRKFGPCVIQNVRVRERAWDAGVLVNAEVSFDLEQVPEWTINDGAVDIARPGRQSLVNDPLLPRNQPEATPPPGSEDTERKPAEEKGGGGGQPLTQADSYNPVLCDFATKQSGIFDTFVNRNYGFGGLTTSLGNLLNARSNENIFEKFYNMKRDFYSGSQEIGNYVDNRLIQNGSPGCVRGLNPSNPTYKSQTQEILTGGGKFFLGIQLQSRSQQAAGFAKACAEQTKRFIDEWKKETPKCQAQRTANAALASSAEELRRCEQYKIGNSCNSIGLRATCSSVNGGNTVYCRRNTSTSGPRYIWSAF